MHTFLDNFHQGGRYSARIASHQEGLKIEQKFTDQKYLSILSLQTDYLNLDSSSDFGINSEMANTVQKKGNFCGGVNHSAEKCFKSNRQGKEKFRAVGDSDNRRTERTPRKCFGCGSEDHLIAKCLNPSKENENRRKQVSFHEKVNHACNNVENDIDKKIYASVARMSGNDKYSSGNFGGSLQLTNWILDSGATCHMTPEVSDFITGSL